MKNKVQSNLQIVMFPDPILLQPCLPVTAFDSKLHSILDRMAKVMVLNQGMGLAANQVGISKTFFLVQDLRGKIWEFINPSILEKDGKSNEKEGCLSLPGHFINADRANDITIRAFDRKGEEFTVAAEGLEAVCIQHEYDHLMGIFFLSKEIK